MPAARTVASATVALGLLFGAAALVAGLPAHVPPSWPRASGPVVWLGGPMVAFLLPTAAGVMRFVLRDLRQRSSPADRGPELEAVYDAINLHVTVFICALHAVVLAGLLGWLWGRPWAAQLVPVLLGLTMVGVGNHLPRTRPNLVVGLATRRTLASRTVWMGVHRRIGYTLVAGGVAVIAGALAIPRPVGPAAILMVGPVTALGISLLTVWHRERRDA